MRLIVLDTNVIVSAALKPESIPAYIVMKLVLEGPVSTVTCPPVTSEYLDVIERPKFTGYGFPPEWLDRLIRKSIQLPKPRSWHNLLPDPKDKPFVVLAHAAGAWLVTENKKHFPESACNDVTVISPAEYLNHFVSHAAS